MASDLNSPHPPGTGAFRPGRDQLVDAPDHMHNWNQAVQAALDNYGRSPGLYPGQLVLSATIEVKNPGNIIEYFAKFV
jgi:hypothetical protein